MTKIVEKLGGKPVGSHPSTFWFADSKLMLTIYVDDLMLSGPEDAHEHFWKVLAEDVHLEDPEPLDRFLGRHHEFLPCDHSNQNCLEFFTPVPKGDEEQSHNESNK